MCDFKNVGNIFLRPNFDLKYIMGVSLVELDCGSDSRAGPGHKVINL